VKSVYLNFIKKLIYLLTTRWGNMLTLQLTVSRFVEFSFYWSQSYITTSQEPVTVPCIQSNESSNAHTVLKSILILSSHLCLGILSFLSLCYYSVLTEYYLQLATTVHVSSSSCCTPNSPLQDVLSAPQNKKIWQGGLYKQIASFGSRFKSVVCCCCQHNISSFFRSCVSPRVIANINGLS